MTDLMDVIIIGAGPAGMSAALYTGRGRLKTLVIEKGMPGGQILTSDWIENYPGFPEGISPFQLMQDFRKQAEMFGAEIVTDGVESVEQSDKGWRVVCQNQTYTGRTAIICTGSDYQKLKIPGEAELTGRGVSYCATCDAAFFKEKDIAVVGGGDNALKEAIFLAKFGKSLKVIHRRDELRGEKILQERVFAHEKIEVLWNTVVEKINGKDLLESLTLKNVKDGSLRDLKVDGLFVSIGTLPNTGAVKTLVELDDWGAIIVDKNMRTSREGLYAAGDVSNACPKQVATAVGSGVHAAITVVEYLQNLGI